MFHCKLLSIFHFQMVGDACLRAGSPLDALAHLKAATSQARSTMYIACMAGMVSSISIKVALLLMGWMQLRMTPVLKLI